jgi:hypothetical protein
VEQLCHFPAAQITLNNSGLTTRSQPIDVLKDH